MNAYIASFMLLLFNAVGLAVPASAAAEERVIADLESTTDVAESNGVDRSSAIELVRAVASDHHRCAAVLPDVHAPLARSGSCARNPVWAVVAMRTDTGDKLEHEEGAP